MERERETNLFRSRQPSCYPKTEISITLPGFLLLFICCFLIKKKKKNYSKKWENYFKITPDICAEVAK